MTRITKILIITLSIIISTFTCFSQDRHEVFLIGTSSIIPKGFVGIFNGFGHFTLKRKPYHNGIRIFYNIGNCNRGYKVEFDHSNTIGSKRSELLVIDIKLSELYSFSTMSTDNEIIYIDEFFTDAKSKEDIKKWELFHRRNKSRIWIIDYSSAYKSSEELDKPDMIKIVEVEFPYIFL